MDTDKERYRLRLVLSYHEKVTDLLEKVATRAADTPTHPDRSQNLTAFYEQHAATAGQELNRLRTGLAAELEGLSTAIGSVRKSLEAMAPRGTPGGSVARHGRQRTKKLSGELARLLTAYEGVSRLTNLRTAADAGGFIDLPVEEYEQRLLQYGKPSPRRRPSKRVWVVLAAVAVVLFIVLWSAQPHTRRNVIGRSKGEVSVQTVIPRNAPGILRVVMQNSAEGMASVYVPWPDGTPDANAADFGFVLEVSQSPEDEFHLLPTMDSGWRYDNAPLKTPARLLLVPDMTLPLELDVADLRRQVGTLNRVRLILTKGNGKTLQLIEFDAADVF